MGTSRDERGIWDKCFAKLGTMFTEGGLRKMFIISPIVPSQSCGKRGGVQPLVMEDGGDEVCHSRSRPEAASFRSGEGRDGAGERAGEEGQYFAARKVLKGSNFKRSIHIEIKKRKS